MRTSPISVPFVLAGGKMRVHRPTEITFKITKSVGTVAIFCFICLLLLKKRNFLNKCYLFIYLFINQYQNRQIGHTSPMHFCH